MTEDLNIPILITGGTGFVGSHLVQELIARKFTNIYVTTYMPEHSYVSDLLSEDRIIPIDLTDTAATFALIERLQPTWIFHLASIADSGKSFERATAVFQNNIVLQLNILEAVRQKSPKSRLLVIGSGMEYGMIKVEEVGLFSRDHLDSMRYPTIDESFPLNPTNPYAVSKVTQDLLALSFVYSYDLDIVRVRPFNHIGERQTVDFAIPAFASQISKIEKGEQEKIMVGNLEAVRDFTDVKDVVKSYILLLEKGVKGEVYNVGSAKGYSMQVILAKMCSYAQKHIEIETDPSRVRPVDVPIAVANITKIKSIGWTPSIPLEDTLQRVMDEWRSQG